MTTAVNVTQTSASTDIDFDTRLALASAGMDAVLAHRHGVTLAEARDALAGAQEAPELLAPEAPAFEPHPLLKAAGDVIRVRGWVQGMEVAWDGKVCALGAIRIAAARRCEDDNDAVVELLNRIAADTNRAYGISMWNDRPGQTKDNVLKLLY